MITSHWDKLCKLAENPKLPQYDRARTEEACQRYREWIACLEEIAESGEQVTERMVAELNEYRKWIDLEFVFDSEEDFLYRQKGQIKLESSVIEEFLPRLVRATVLRNVGSDLTVGPAQCFSSVYFTCALDRVVPGAGIDVRTKDQDFVVGRPVFLRASHFRDFAEALEQETTVAYCAVECKTNLDKTMFQEAVATASDLKAAVSGARYFLMCEWLDMPPISSGPTDIDQVFILRKAKRLSSGIRSEFSTSEGRKRMRQTYKRHLEEHPYDPAVFQEFLEQLGELVHTSQDPSEEAALQRGYF